MTVTVNIRRLPLNAKGCAVATNGDILITNHDVLFCLDPATLNIKYKTYIEGQESHECHQARLYRTRSGCLLYASQNTNALYISEDDGRSFQKVIPNFGGMIRGFDQRADGTLFLGRYGRVGPAIVFKSSDGKNWTELASWDARHIHDLRVDSRTDALYVVVGEGNGLPTEESHAIYRLNPNEESFERIFGGGGKRRPLFTCLTPFQGRLILGTDHFEGDNYIGDFICDADLPCTVNPIFHIPNSPSEQKAKPFIFFMEEFEESLFVGIRGSGAAMLIATDDLENWQVLEMTAMASEIGHGFLNASRDPQAPRLVISGTPGYVISASNNKKPVGFFLPALRSGGEPTPAPKDTTPSQAGAPAIESPSPSTPPHNQESAKPLFGNDGGVDAHTGYLQRTVTDPEFPEGWGLPLERQTRQVLLDVDPKYEFDICKGYFYGASPLRANGVHNRIHMRESLVVLLTYNFSRHARILDYGCGTGQFLLYLNKHGFTNLHGWDHNQRWLDASEALFQKLSRPEDACFERKSREVIYDLAGATEKPFDFISMFGLVYGHGIDIEPVFPSVYSALNPGGLFVFNDGKRDAEQNMLSIERSGLMILSRITEFNNEGKCEGGKGENHIYICRR